MRKLIIGLVTSLTITTLTAPAANSASASLSLYDGFERLANAATPQTTPTYDGSGQATEPDIVFFPAGWHGYKYWLADVPYPNGNDRFENPSVLASDDAVSWEIPAGGANPLVGAPPCDHNNDPDLLYNPATDELWLYYLDTRRSSRCGASYNDNYLKLMKSSDGVHWSDPLTLIDWPLATNPLYVSPTITVVNGTFYLWAVNSATFTMRTASSSDGMHFGPSSGLNIADLAWHVDVEYIPSKSEYWMLLDYPSSKGQIRFARSTDRINWTTYPNAAMYPSSGWDSNLYRSTLLFDSATSALRVWYSAYNDSFIWHVGQATVDYRDLSNRLVPAGGWTRKQGTGTWSTSTEQVIQGEQSAKLVQQAGTSMWLSKGQALPNNFLQQWYMYDDLDTSAFKMVRSTNSSDNRVGVGVWTGASVQNYVYHNKAYQYAVTSIPRTLGWHKFGLLLRSDSSVTFFIDDQQVGTITGQFANANQVQVEGYAGGLTTFYVDDIEVSSAP